MKAAWIFESALRFQSREYQLKIDADGYGAVCRQGKAVVLLRKDESWTLLAGSAAIFKAAVELLTAASVLS